MHHSDQGFYDLRAAYNAGASAARAGRMLSIVPGFSTERLAEAWRDGWTDAALAVGMVGTDWRATRQPTEA